MLQYFREKKYDLFFPPYQITFFLVIDQAHAISLHFSMNFYKSFYDKKISNTTPYGKFSLNFKQHSRTRKELNKITCLNVFLVRFLSYLYNTRIWLNLIMFKVFRSSRSQMFHKIGVLKKFAKFTGKHLCLSHFLIKLRTCFPMIFVEFSRTPVF